MIIGAVFGGCFEARPCWRRGAGAGLPSSWVRSPPREKTPLRILAPQVYLIMELLRSGKLLAAVLTIFSQDMDSKAARQVILPRRYLLVELLTSGELLGRCWRRPC